MNFCVSRDHKSSKNMGTVEIDVPITLSRKLGEIITFFNKHRQSEWVLTNARGGKMSRSSLGQLIMRETSRVLGKKIGTRHLRILFAKDPEVENARRVIEKHSRRALHSQQEHKAYAKHQ